MSSTASLPTTTTSPQSSSATARTTPTPPPNLNKGFVKRSGSTLVVKDDPENPTTPPTPLQFISFNIPTLHWNEDVLPNRVPDPFEQTDALLSISQMGGRVTRTYVLGMVPADWKKMKGEVPVRHVVGVVEGGELPSGNWTVVPATMRERVRIAVNEDLFVGLDSAIAIAGHHGIRLIIPLIDHWHWWGGVETFTSYYSKPSTTFFTDPEITRGFTLLAQHVATRINTITGIAYKDDPTILAWETGNELGGYDGVPVPATWTGSLAEAIKKVDPNHLIADGSFQVNGWDPDALADPRVDLHSGHYYQMRFEKEGLYGPGGLLLSRPSRSDIPLTPPRSSSPTPSPSPSPSPNLRPTTSSTPLVPSPSPSPPAPSLLKRHLRPALITFFTLLLLTFIPLTVLSIRSAVLKYTPRTYADRVKEDFGLVTGRYGKPFFVGEFGLDSVESLVGVMDAVVETGM
ncbi:hypothetical protein HDU67_005201, partial [Dinochytrium kinnereticum]